MPFRRPQLLSDSQYHDCFSEDDSLPDPQEPSNISSEDRQESQPSKILPGYEIGISMQSGEASRTDGRPSVHGISQLKGIGSQEESELISDRSEGPLNDICATSRNETDDAVQEGESFVRPTAISPNVEILPSQVVGGSYPSYVYTPADLSESTPFPMGQEAVANSNTLGPSFSLNRSSGGGPPMAFRGSGMFSQLDSLLEHSHHERVLDTGEDDSEPDAAMSTIINTGPEEADDTPSEKIVDLTEDDIPSFTEYDSVAADDIPFVKEEESGGISQKNNGGNEDTQHDSSPPEEDAEQLGLFEGLSDNNSKPVYPTLSPPQTYRDDIDMTALQANGEQSEMIPEANSDASSDGEPGEEPTPERCATPTNQDGALPEKFINYTQCHGDVGNDMCDSSLIEKPPQAVQVDAEIRRESELFEDTQIQSGPSASLTPIRSSESRAAEKIKDNSRRAAEFQTPQSELDDAPEDQPADDQNVAKKRKRAEPGDSTSQSEDDALVLKSDEVFDSIVMEKVFNLLKCQPPVPEMGFGSHEMNDIHASFGRTGK